MSMIIMNGSPKAERGNTEIFIREFVNGIQSSKSQQSVEDQTVAVCYMAKENSEQIAAKLQEYDTVIIAFPLYVHAMPGSVKKVLECMKPVEGNGKKLGFIIQYGFMEGAQSQYVVRYLETWITKMNYESVGIVVHGGSAGVYMMPEKMNRKLFELLQTLGKSLCDAGTFDRNAVEELHKPYQLTKGQSRMYQFMAKLGVGDAMFWNMQLKQNDAMQHRYDKPFA